MQRAGTRLTEGSVWGTILRFSLPFLLANLLQALYGAADLFMVGHFSTSAADAAVATGSQVMQTLTSLAVGLTTGATVLVGQHYGAGEVRELASAVKTALLIFGLLSLLLSAGVLCFLKPICALMQVPAEAYADTVRYLRICAWGVPFIMGYNVVSGILRGLGDARTPLLFIFFACAANIVLDLLLVGYLHMSAAGAAGATVLAQAVGLALSACYLLLHGHLRTYRRGRPRFRCLAARRMLSTGLPIALQEGLVNGSFLMITAIVNHMGLVASAAVGVVEKLIVFSMLPTTAIASAIAAVTSQHKGAGMMARAWRCLRAGVALSLVFGLAFFLAAQAAPAMLVGLFTGDAAVIRAGSWYLRAYSLDSVLVCLVFCLNTYFTGSGHPVFPLVHSVVSSCLVRIPLSWYLSLQAWATMFHIGFAAPAATLLSFLLCAAYLRRFGLDAPD